MLIRYSLYSWTEAHDKLTLQYFQLCGCVHQKTCLCEEVWLDAWVPHPDMFEKSVVQHSHTQVDYPVQSCVGSTYGVLTGWGVALPTTLHEAPEDIRCTILYGLDQLSVSKYYNDVRFSRILMLMTKRSVKRTHWETHLNGGLQFTRAMVLAM